MEDQNQVDIRFALFAGIFVLTILSVSVVIFFVFYRKRLYKKHAEMMQMETQHKEDLLFSSITSEENERKRISADIHDELGSIFVNLSYSLNKIEMRNAASPDLSGTRGLIEKGLDSVRRIARTIMPPELELYGLIFTIENFCDKLNASGIGISADFNCTVDEFDEPLPTSIALYRVLQELTTNTLKHAGATSIIIRFDKSSSQYVLKYQDNGKGFNASAIEAMAGFGLKNIESRIRMIKGTISYAADLQKGFSAEIIFPITKL